MIASEQQAEDIGTHLTNGRRDRDFKVYWYEHRHTRLTLFGVDLLDGRDVRRDPRLTVSSNTQQEK